jgi:glycerol uptake facilitator-like aquaporin
MTLAQRLSAEAIGTGLLTATVIGSGVMAEQLANGNDAVALLANTAATVAALTALIALFAPISGAHFNPLVSLVMATRRKHSWSDAAAYAGVQVVAAIVGAALAHAMFALPLVEPSTHARTGAALWLSEFVATFGLLLVVLGHRRSEDAPWMVAAWIGAAYWFTASTSFANPAVAIARSLTDTFSGIRPVDVPAFVIAETLGALAALALGRIVFGSGAGAPEHASVPGENERRRQIL